MINENNKGFNGGQVRKSKVRYFDQLKTLRNSSLYQITQFRSNYQESWRKYFYWSSKRWIWRKQVHAVCLIDNLIILSTFILGLNDGANKISYFRSIVQPNGNFRQNASHWFWISNDFYTSWTHWKLKTYGVWILEYQIYQCNF